MNDQTITDLLITAFEGGSNYWIDEVEYVGIPYNPGCPRYARLSECKYGKIIFSIEDEPNHSLTWDMLKAGVDLMEEKYPQHYADILTEDWDAGTADVALQLALFKELVYG